MSIFNSIFSNLSFLLKTGYNTINFRLVPNVFFIKKQFKRKLGYSLEINNPTTFNEKIQWLKLNYKKPEITMAADKYEVREYIKEKIGENYLIPLWEIFDDYKKINFVTLPNSFALKATHGSGWNIICHNKNKLNFKQLNRTLKYWQKTSYYQFGKEWAYKNIKPRFICERLILDENNKSPMDYKFFCFNGVPRFIQIDIDRFETHKRLFYDVKWNKQPFGLLYDIPDFELDPPNNLSLMVNLAEKLASDFPFVRVDFYNLNGKIFFGELTFYPENGTGVFIPQNWDHKFGELLKLPIS